MTRQKKQQNFGQNSTHNIISIFPTNILIVNYDKDILVEKIFVQEKLEYSKNLLNKRSKNSFILNEKILKGLKDFFQKYVNEYTKNVLYTKTELIITQSWSNINNTNESHHVHSHPNSILSGVFYLNTVKGTPIIFEKSYNDNISFTSEKHDILNATHFAIDPVPGDLLIFPSTLKHKVLNNNTKDVRISISFNTFVKNFIGSENELTYLSMKDLCK
jgi:uncharacterized protein (TIGR02466 family)